MKTDTKIVPAGKTFRNKWIASEWLWLIPVFAALIVCYLRFLYFHNDDHPEIIEYIARRGNWSGSCWDFFSLRFGNIVRRFFLAYEDVADERICPTDLSWPSKLHINQWSLSNFYPTVQTPVRITGYNRNRLV